MTWSLRRRLTGMIVGVVAIILVVLGASLYVGVRDAAWRQHDAALASRARAIASTSEYDDEGYEIALPQEPGLDAEVWGDDGQVVARSHSLGGHDLPRDLASKPEPSFGDIALSSGEQRRAVGLRFAPKGEAATRAPRSVSLVLADNTDDVDATVGRIRLLFAVLGSAGLLAIGIMAMWSLRRGLRPLTRLGAELDRIDDRNLATRLATSEQPIELAGLVRKLEELLARIDASLARERQFSADVSHELRTPLAGLRNIIEVTNMAERPPAAYRAALHKVLAIIEQLSSLVESLLALGRVEAGQLEVKTAELHLSDFVDECWAPYESLARERHVAFRNRVEADRVIVADRAKLRVVVTNILANAAEYTEAGGWIEVVSNAAGMIDIVDSGPPLPGEQLERIFDRLWRGDASRTGTGLHCGIGLSLARAISERLALSLTAHCDADGRVTFRLAS